MPKKVLWGNQEKSYEGKKMKQAITYDENANLLDFCSPHFCFTWLYQNIKEEAEGHRKRRNECFITFLTGGFLDLSKDYFGGALAEHKYYSECKRAVNDSEERYRQYIKDKKAKGVVFLDSKDTDFW
jgi:hypothetical protein